MKNILRILFILIFLAAGIFSFLHPAKTETNILNAVFSNNSADKTVVELSGRYSSIINVTAKSDDASKSAEAIENFYKNIDKNAFTKQDISAAEILETYKKYHNNLLSLKNIKRLESGHYEETAAESLEELYNPLSIPLLSLEEDPFLLFTDYIKSLAGGSGDLSSVEYDGKYFSIITLKMNPDTALSPSLANKETGKLIKLQKKLSVDGVKIYLTGAPVHSYYASSRSMREINIICFLSAIFIFAIFKYYFRNLKLFIPAALTLSAGMLAGYIVCSLFFRSIHVLTFVFSTTLIGICIDYTLHYFIEKDLAKIFKSLTVSMVTTVSAFAVLLFSGVELLKQISIFTMTGLFCVYSIVALFYPFLKFEFEERGISFEIPQKYKKVLVYSFAALAFLGLFFIKFNDDIRNMYVPSKQLLHSEQLFKKVTGSSDKITFAVVNGKDFQNMLENEETLTKELDGEKFQSLSKFIPSIKQQKENRILRKNLYKNSLKNYASFLTSAQVEKLLNERYPDEFFTMENKSILDEFLIDKNTSLVILYDIKNPDVIQGENIKYIDVQKTISDRIKNCRNKCLIMLLPVFAVLFVLLCTIYKFKTALKIILPSIIASAFSVGVLGIFGVEINMFHILAIFLITGFGLDYSVFRASGLKGSKDAVLLSCATTVFSFLLLAFTGFKLISSLGLILTIGLCVSYLTSLAFDYGAEDR